MHMGECGAFGELNGGQRDPERVHAFAAKATNPLCCQSTVGSCMHENMIRLPHHSGARAAICFLYLWRFEESHIGCVYCVLAGVIFERHSGYAVSTYRLKSSITTTLNHDHGC